MKINDNVRNTERTESAIRDLPAAGCCSCSCSNKQT